MDNLFVINRCVNLRRDNISTWANQRYIVIFINIFYRYRDVNEDVVVDIAEQEAKHLEKLKKRIAERKSAYATKKTSNVITLKPQKVVEEPKEDLVELKEKEVAKTGEEAKIENSTNVTQKQDRKKAKPSHEFKVLGVNDFEKKTKVISYLLNI